MDLVANKIRPILQKFMDSFSSAPAANNGKGKGREEDNSDDHLSELQVFLSDWHFLSFIDSIGIFDRVTMLHFFSLQCSLSNMLFCAN